MGDFTLHKQYPAYSLVMLQLLSAQLGGWGDQSYKAIWKEQDDSGIVQVVMHNPVSM